MTRLFTYLLFGLLLTGQAIASPSSSYNKGNDAYAKKDYPNAITQYLEAYRAGMSHPYLLYNLGNAYYQSGDLGRAILFMERAFKQNPYDEDISHNLNFLRTQIQISVGQTQPRPFFQRALGAIAQMDPFWILTLHMIAFGLCLVFLIVKLAQGSSPLGPHRLNRWLLIAFAVYLALGALLITNWARERGETFAVITAEAVALRAGPGDDQTEIIKLAPGIKLQVIYEKDNWYQVKIAGYASHSSLDGLYGWVFREKLSVI